MAADKQAQATLPDESVVRNFYGGEHGIASTCAAELVFARRRGVDSNKESLRSATHCGMM